MAHKVKLEILNARSYPKKTGKNIGELGWVCDCLIRDEGNAFADVHFSDVECKPGIYSADVVIGMNREGKRTFYLNNVTEEKHPSVRAAL